MEPKKLEVGDLFKSIDFLGNIISSNDNIHTYSQSPIHVLVYNEIMKYSKEEIEGSTGNWTQGKDLYQATLKIRNPFIFSGLLKKGAFFDKIEKGSKWILESFKDPSNDLYNVVYYLEAKRNGGFEYGLKDITAEDVFQNTLFDHYLYNLDTPEKYIVLDKYYKDFGTNRKEQILNYIVQNHVLSRIELCDYLVSKLKHDCVDFSTYNSMNKLLPKSNLNSSKFFISSTDIPRIKNLLEAGFKFNEKEYSYNGDNLFIAIVKSERKDIIETILPYLHDVAPTNGDWKEQNSFIDNITQTYPNIGKFIQATYNKCLIESSLRLKKSEDKKKVKI